MRCIKILFCKIPIVFTHYIINFSKKIFGGGGHKNAAGAVSKRSLDDTIFYFLDSLKNYKELLI